MSKCELIRFHTKDELELQGLLFEPQVNEGTTKVDTAVLHIHGWTGNFYENVFIDSISKELIENGIAFLSINTRGAGHVQEFLKKTKSSVEYVKNGGSLEIFEESLLDIDAALKFLKAKGYKKFILQGHSTGCQKAIFYKHTRSQADIIGLALLEPTDDPAVVKRLLGEKYQTALAHSRKLVEQGLDNSPMPSFVSFGVMLSAQKFLSMSDPLSTEGRLLDFSGDLKEIKEIQCPTLAVYGENTEYQERPTDMLTLMRDKMQDCKTLLIKNTNHWFFGNEILLAKHISTWVKAVKKYSPPLSRY